MEIGTASAINLYKFQTTAKNSGQSSAVLQALTQVYADSKASAGTDPMSLLLTSASMAPVANAISTLTSASTAAAGDPGTLATADLQAYLTYGGLNAASAASLFSSSTTSFNSGSLQGFDAAISANSILALTAYQATQQYTTNQAAKSATSNLLG